MEDHKSIDQMFGRFHTIVNNLRSLGKTYDNYDHITKILQSFHRQWRPQVTTLMPSKDLKKFLIEELLSTLKKENDGIKKENESLKEIKEIIDLTQSLAKVFNGSKHLKMILMCKRHPYDKYDIGHDKKKDLKKDISTSHCLNCGKFRHLSYDYRDRPKGLSKLSKIGKKGPKRIWVPKNMIIFIVDLLDNRKKTLIIKGLCSKTLSPSQEDELLLEHSFPYIDNVLFVEDLKHHILSISQLCDSGYDVSFNKGECIIQNLDGSLLLRLISKLKKHNLIKGLPSLVYKSKNIVLASRPLEFLHIDLFGPTKTTSMSRKHYELIVVDTPYELLKGKQPNISYFHPIGSKYFIINSKENLGKFDPKSDKRKFLEYSDMSKAYRVYNSRTLTVEKSILVKFNNSKLDKELSELNESCTYMNLEDSQTLSNEPSLVEKPKDDKIKPTLRNWQMKTTRSTFKDQAQIALIFELEPKSIDDALLEEDKFIIGTKWIFRNKTRSIAQDYSQQDGIDLTKTYAPMARLKPIHILLSFNDIINEEVYAKQPFGVESDVFLNHVLNLKKTFYALKQAPHVWYVILNSFLIENGFERGKVDTCKNYDSYFIIVQIYVDDIIFGATNKSLCEEFYKMM
ncbi:hypothetical protein CR513_18992, partial [Mucuna pruriens]